jgi:hypothetical protein
MLKGIGFSIIWSKIINDETCEGAGRFFALVQKNK